MKVSIIGAGFSGLSVAYHLTKYNHENAASGKRCFDINILEARDRTGGRVCPVDLNPRSGDPVMVDMGGQWLEEASKKNPLVQLLKEINVDLLYTKQHKMKTKEGQERQPKQHQPNNPGPNLLANGIYLPDGTRIPDPLFKRARKFYYKTLNEYKDKDVSQQTSFQDLLDAALKSSKDKGPNAPSSPLFQKIIRYLSHRTECYEGGRMSELSVSLDELYHRLGGPDEIAEGGYHAVLEKLVDFVGRDNIHLNCPVQEIHYEPLLFDESTTSENDDNTPPQVRIQYCAEEQTKTLSADCCVCTVPLGVLQQGGLRFDPPLGDDRERSIQAMGFGVLDKVMMLFEKQFWEENFYAGVTPEDPTRIQSFVDCSVDYGGKPVLAMFAAGNVARRFDRPQEGLSDEQLLAEIMTTLRTLFGDDAPDPVSFQVSRWLQDPYAYGSYSFAKVGSTEHDYDQVAKPAGKNLFFAGEHTNKHHHSTVHGAWMTGKREADRLIANAKALKTA
ncbi:Peroxisomal N(1)-acetyl-spermine/spermidine oxidase [Seminavis robusta]|uniref:Peroxisomal N(1)-acetyl-spermine/spermidine oxidase n=1 Tax=Seminavis robusta TaxID=568900 RepID=A0A9N8EXB8_9STRA|nr:Peroxisomal N(1)-acetyl-spermine/spermidine oxidase [Seminavis robusta]|eukprot:Sro1832_g300430.1 Peroxisomal N(1)-acetyl-spermine/spermidine oxidase (502) ;mRNA; r:9658-11163